MPNIEFGYTSLNKKGEELCGDKVEISKENNRCTLVLADGLGSGVKANILATLTSKILCTMIASDIPLDECLDTIVSSLPVCRDRGVAYSTFSILSLDNYGIGYLVEFDNPPAVFIHAGRLTPLSRESRIYRDKKIYLSRLELDYGDVLFVMSDGVVHAGIGQTLNFGWDKAEIAAYVETAYDEKLSASTLASILANACYDLYAHQPGDDTTVLCVKYRKNQTANIMIGPPVNPARDEFVVSEFMKEAGKKIVCGGTSSQVVARCLNKPLTTSFDFYDKEVPPIGFIDGIDLTCEGVLTLKKMLWYAEQYASNTNPEIKLFKGKDGASRLAEMLLVEASTVNLFVGRNVNLAHEGLEIDNKSKLDYVVKLVNLLKKLGKVTNVRYY